MHDHVVKLLFQLRGRLLVIDLHHLLPSDIKDGSLAPGAQELSQPVGPAGHTEDLRIFCQHVHSLFPGRIPQKRFASLFHTTK